MSGLTSEKEFENGCGHNKWRILSKIMMGMIGYMITLTTYGSWMQGDKRGYVKKWKNLFAKR